MKKAPAKMKKASMAKKKGEKMPMKKDPKTGKMVPAFLKMKKGSMAKKELVGNQKNLNEGLPKGYWDKQMVAKDEVNEDYDSLVKKLKKQGESEKAAKAIAGAVASYKAKGGGKGPTAKQKR